MKTGAIIMDQYKCVFFSCIAFFTFTVNANANFPASPALLAMMEQVQETYLTPQGTDFNEMSKQHSLVNVAVLLGFGMRAQQIFTDGDDQLERAFNDLQEDVYILLDWLVKERNYRDISGEPIRNSDLIEAYTASLTGKLNSFAAQNYHVFPDQVRHTSVLNMKANTHSQNDFSSFLEKITSDEYLKTLSFDNVFQPNSSIPPEPAMDSPKAFFTRPPSR